MDRSPEFSERRKSSEPQRSASPERRQFVDGREHLSPEVRELAHAIDEYKLENHRRFIDYEELLSVVVSLGYRKVAPPAIVSAGRFSATAPRSDLNRAQALASADEAEGVI